MTMVECFTTLVCCCFSPSKSILGVFCLKSRKNLSCLFRMLTPSLKNPGLELSRIILILRFSFIIFNSSLPALFICQRHFNPQNPVLKLTSCFFTFDRQGKGNLFVKCAFAERMAVKSFFLYLVF